jgi:L-iditol 2-dehydrogenase
MSLGHESAGVVSAVGSEVSNFKVGDKVALEVGLPCEECDRCKEGRYNICKGMRFRSSAKAFPHAQGTLQERINHPAQWCHKCVFNPWDEDGMIRVLTQTRLPDTMSLSLGALLEPLSVAIQASKRASLAPGSTVLVFGAGAVGLLVAAMAKISGAGTVVIADIDAGRVQFAVENKFAHKNYTVPMKRGNTIDEQLEIAKEVAAEVGKITKESGGEIGEVDAVFECTGVPSCVQASIFVCSLFHIPTSANMRY